MKFKLKLPRATRWAWGVVMTTAAVAQAAPADDGPRQGCYRQIDELDVQRNTSAGTSLPPYLVRSQRRVDHETGSVDAKESSGGKTVEWSLPGPADFKPIHYYLARTLSHEEALSMLRSTCPASIGRPCNGSEVQVERQGQDQWKLTLPLRVPGSGPNATQQFEQGRQTLSDPRLLNNMTPEQRAQTQAALRQLPQTETVRQFNADLADAAEAEAARHPGVEAEALRESARHIRSGKAKGGTVTGIVYWTRIADSCPK
jgi:hypothetical protein